MLFKKIKICDIIIDIAGQFINTWVDNKFKIYLLKILVIKSIGG